jgi:Family of unknown function (DUF5681)
MRFQPGQSGNPAGRPPGSLNKKTLAVESAMAERAEEIVNNVMDRAMDGQGTAMRLCMDRLAPTGRNRPLVIDLPVIKTPEDAEAAVAVVTAELAAGNLSISEASALMSLIDRMVRLAERMWKFAQARLQAQRREAVLFGPAADAEAASAADPQAAQTGASEAPETSGEAGAPLYSPVNSGFATGGDAADAVSLRQRGSSQPGAPSEDKAPPLPRAA